MPSSLRPSTIFVGYSSACSSSVATGRISRSTKLRTALRISVWSSVRPSVWQRRPMAWRVVPWRGAGGDQYVGAGRRQGNECDLFDPGAAVVDWQTVPDRRRGDETRGCMPQRVVIHIGLMKSGTTFLQGRLNANREELAEQGVLFPGPTWRRHVNAVADFMEAKERQPGSWDSLREEINDHPGTAVVSMEYLAMLGQWKIPLLAESFDTPDLRIVIGVRDLGRSVPAMWQEAV